MPAVELCGGSSSVPTADVLIRPRSSLGSTCGHVAGTSAIYENQAIVYKKINQIGFDCLLDFSNKFHNNCKSKAGAQCSHVLNCAGF